MPLIQTKFIDEAVAPTEKKDLDSDAMVSIAAKNFPPEAWIDLEEVLSDEWDIGAAHDDRRHA